MGKAGWFWIDFATIVPWDKLIGGAAAKGKIKLVRILRLLRMFRLVRVIKLFKRWHTAFGFSFALVEVCKILGMTLLLVHWLACIWGYIGIDWVTPTHDTWLVKRLAREHKILAETPTLEVYTLAAY